MNDHSAAAAASERQGVANGMSEEGLGVIADEEARYEDYMAAAQLGLLGNKSLDGPISGEEGGGTAQPPQNTSAPPPSPCEQRLGEMFGDPGAVMRTTYDFNGGYRGLNPAAAAKFSRDDRSEWGNRFFDAEHLFNFPHLSGNLAGTATTNVYIPSNYVRGSITKPTKDDNIVTAYYKNFGSEKNVTLAIFHVADYGVRNVGSRLRIGTTGGLGGNSNGVNIHSHFELWRGRGYRPPGARDSARIPFTPVFCQ